MIKINLDEKIKKLKKKYNLPNIENKFVDKQQYEQYQVDSYNASKGNLDSFDGYNCTLCKNKGDLMYISNGYQYSKQCKCMEVRKTISNMKRSGLKDIIRDYTLDKYEEREYWQKNIKTKAIKYIEDSKPNWWYINGISGSGKTHICTAICREYLLKGEVVKYMLWKQESTVLKACINDYEIYEKKMNQLKHAEILYIDDFLKPIKDKEGHISPPTTADINLAFELIDFRKNANLRTVISSERNILELLEIDNATTGRIIEKATKEYIINIGRDASRDQRLKGILETVI